MSKPVLVIFTSNTCVHCTTYKQRDRERILNEIRSKYDVNIIEIEVVNGDRSAFASYHPDLENWHAWYPGFALFTGESWANKRGKLVGLPGGGKMVEGKLRLEGPTVPIATLPTWLGQSLASPTFQRTAAKGLPTGNALVRTAGARRDYMLYNNYNNSEQDLGLLH